MEKSVKVIWRRITPAQTGDDEDEGSFADRLDPDALRPRRQRNPEDPDETWDSEFEEEYEEVLPTQLLMARTSGRGTRGGVRGAGGSASGVTRGGGGGPASPTTVQPDSTARRENSAAQISPGPRGGRGMTRGAARGGRGGTSSPTTVQRYGNVVVVSSTGGRGTAMGANSRGGRGGAASGFTAMPNITGKNSSGQNTEQSSAQGHSLSEQQKSQTVIKGCGKTKLYGQVILFYMDNPLNLDEESDVSKTFFKVTAAEFKRIFPKIDLSTTKLDQPLRLKTFNVRLLPEADPTLVCIFAKVELYVSQDLVSQTIQKLNKVFRNFCCPGGEDPSQIPTTGTMTKVYATMVHLYERKLLKNFWLPPRGTAYEELTPFDVQSGTRGTQLPSSEMEVDLNDEDGEPPASIAPVEEESQLLLEMREAMMKEMTEPEKRDKRRPSRFVTEEPEKPTQVKEKTKAAVSKAGMANLQKTLATPLPGDRSRSGCPAFSGTKRVPAKSASIGGESQDGIPPIQSSHGAESMPIFSTSTQREASPVFTTKRSQVPRAESSFFPPGDSRLSPIRVNETQSNIASRGAANGTAVSVETAGKGEKTKEEGRREAQAALALNRTARCEEELNCGAPIVIMSGDEEDQPELADDEPADDALLEESKAPKTTKKKEKEKKIKLSEPTLEQLEFGSIIHNEVLAATFADMKKRLWMLSNVRTLITKINLMSAVLTKLQENMVSMEDRMKKMQLRTNWMSAKEGTQSLIVIGRLPLQSDEDVRQVLGNRNACTHVHYHLLNVVIGAERGKGKKGLTTKLLDHLFTGSYILSRYLFADSQEVAKSRKSSDGKDPKLYQVPTQFNTFMDSFINMLPIPGVEPADWYSGEINWTNIKKSWDSIKRRTKDQETTLKRTLSNAPDGECSENRGNMQLSHLGKEALAKETPTTQVQAVPADAEATDKVVPAGAAIAVDLAAAAIAVDSGSDAGSGVAGLGKKKLIRSKHRKRARSPSLSSSDDAVTPDHGRTGAAAKKKATDPTTASHGSRDATGTPPIVREAELRDSGIGSQMQVVSTMTAPTPMVEVLGNVESDKSMNDDMPSQSVLDDGGAVIAEADEYVQEVHDGDEEEEEEDVDDAIEVAEEEEGEAAVSHAVVVEDVPEVAMEETMEEFEFDQDETFC